MKRIIKLSLLILSVVLFSCNNESSDFPAMDDSVVEKSAAITVAEVQAEEATAESTYEVQFFANAEKMLTRWWKYGKKFGMTNKLRYKNQCPDVSISGDEYPKTITLDYGDSTVLRNGKVLSGEIEIYISARASSQDYLRTVTYNDFGIDSVLVNGTATIEVDKVDSMFRKVTSDLTFILADGTEVIRTSERVWQWISGMDTQEDQTDDIISITGNAYAEMNGETYRKEISTALKRMGECKYIVEGVVDIYLNGELICSMDYGDGECDASAVMTNADGTTEVDLSERKLKGKSENNQNQNGNNGNQGGNGNG